MSEATKSVRRDRGQAPYNIVWQGALSAVGADMYFVHPAKSGHSTTTPSNKYIPKRGEVFSIENEVRMWVYTFVDVLLQSGKI